MKLFRLYWDKDKEEVWLNEMARQGWAMTNFTLGRYTFVRITPGEYIYKIDLLENLATTKSSMDYIGFVEDTGAEYVCGWGRWAYFRKAVSEGPFELYTDLDSQIALYKRIRAMMGVVAMAEFMIGIPQLRNINRLGLGIPGYLLIGIVICLGVVIGYAAFTAHLKVLDLQKQKDLFS